MITILFVDIADSTRLYEVRGDVAASEAARRALAFFRETVEGTGGRMIKSLGDGALVAFTESDAALVCAERIRSAESHLDLRIRIGLHHGPVVEEAEDIYGDACNVAARVQSIARPGEILATGEFIQQLSPERARQARSLHSVSLRGRQTPVAIFEIRPVSDGADDPSETTLIQKPVEGPAGAVPTLTVTYRGQEAVLTPTQPRLVIGRDDTCGIRIQARQTSRRHAVIDYSRDSFVLTDQSTNGTFVRASDAYPLALRRDATKLTGSGWIGFGAEPEGDDQDHVAAFVCAVV